MGVRPVIMCGGSGVRLWPASRPSRPKQFIPLIGDRSIFQSTVVRVAGIVTARQRPQSAGGVMFITLEDETGYVNLIVWERVWSRQRRIASGSRLLEVAGMLQKEGGVTHVVAQKLFDRTAMLGNLVTQSRDFR